MLEIIIALRVIGTILLAIKLIGIKRNNIIKKCAGKSLVIDEEKNVYVIKQHYLEMLKENSYATIGIIYVIVAEIINLFIENSIIQNEEIKIIILTILIGILLYILANVIVKVILNIFNKKEKEMIKVDNKLMEEGVIALQTFDE